MLENDRTVELARRERHWLAGIVVSLVVHSILMTILALRLLERLPRAPEPTVQAPPEERVVARLVLPPLERPHRAPAVPRGSSGSTPQAVPPAPPPAEKKDRISIGPPSERRAKDILLRRDEDIPKDSQGNGAIGPGVLPNATPSTARAPSQPARVAEGNRPLAPAPSGAPSITGSLRRLEERLERGGTGLGLGPRGPKHVDGLQYDPQGADFTEWINHLKRELYRNWIAPQAALMGMRGHVTVGFAVARDGSLVDGQILAPSGTSSLDRAARNAVLGSRMLPLPADYGPDVFEIRVTFYYNEGPRPS